MNRTTTTRLGSVLLICGVAISGLTAGTLPPDGDPTDAMVDVIVSIHPGSNDEVIEASAAQGATQITEFDLIDGFAASVPANRLDEIERIAGVTGVTADRALHADGFVQANLPGTTYDPVTQPGSIYQVRQQIGTDAYWNNGMRGAGIDVAVVDTGVSSGVASSVFGTRLLAGTDVSGEANALSDGHGHGTHLASIIAGRIGTGSLTSSQTFAGIAPEARIVSVKVADKNGATTTSKVIAGLDWVALNGRSGGRNIRVVNLSFGAPPLSSYRSDPLAVAVERLWSAGYVVVASTGNTGPWGGLAAPAYDPYVLAVGSLDHRGTPTRDDDLVATYSSAHEDWSARTVDVVVPGGSVQGAMAPGSKASGNSSAKVGTQFVKGTGTSQAAAVASGAVALMIQKRPTAKPDDIKAMIKSNMRWVASEDPRRQGSGALYMPWLYDKTTTGTQTHPKATGTSTTATGTWDGSRWGGSRWAGNGWANDAWLTRWG